MDIFKILKFATDVVEDVVKEVDFSVSDVVKYKPRSDAIDFVTETDIKIHDSITRRLNVLNIPLYSEEGDFDYKDGTCWVLDPIDGTLNLKNGLPFFAVSLALVVDGIPTLGVIATPALSNNLYYGAVGFGAFCNEEPLKVSNRSAKESVVAYDGFRGGEDLYLPKIRETVARHRLLGSTATEMALCASGAFGAVVTPGSKFWDLAAGVALVRAAGGVAKSFDGGDFLPFSNSVIVGSAPIVKAILKGFE